MAFAALVCFIAAVWLATAGHVLAQRCLDALETHNRIRSMHGGMRLQWSYQLALEAQERATQLASQACELPQAAPGENLWACYGGACTDTCAEATQSWYDRAAVYDWTAAPWTSNKEHLHQVLPFIQLVWRSATRLGCSLAHGADGCQVTVCRYDAGASVGNPVFLENVWPALEDPQGAGSKGMAMLDRLPWCSTWAAHGYCTSKWQFDNMPIIQLCPGSCAATWLDMLGHRHMLRSKSHRKQSDSSVQGKTAQSGSR